MHCGTLPCGTLSSLPVSSHRNSYLTVPPWAWQERELAEKRRQETEELEQQQKEQVGPPPSRPLVRAYLLLAHLHGIHSLGLTCPLLSELRHGWSAKAPSSVASL